MVRVQTEVVLIPFSCLEDKIVTHGGPYKFTLLSSPKINTLWENWHHFFLAYKISMKHTYLERENTRIPQVGF